ncbi:endolytic transglycosylase MltG [Desulfolutivibrio sulfoxidireducens]|uniref:endolytic transglycosylase MltG n=1 Tax=Desulfolutivibrio sulfoxidireducens TaxID=2773299 RepID=UPI00159E900C|nr:endolytic transglycosylase MltG [Desulfolutivibrio sulfoxidireducens]QLA17106.1 endolytic transglycosylase MltG [Desulfolutivibrio sulfoxidireducens]
MRYVILAVFLAVLAGAGAAGHHVWTFLTVPPEDPGHEVVVVIEPGQRFADVAARLVERGVVTDAPLFTLYAKYTDLGGKVKAGEFALSTGLTPGKVLEVLTTSAGIQRKLSVPEGLTMRQTARIVEEAGFGTAESFVRAARDKALLEKYAVPADTAEGFLFPETYLFSRKPGNDAAYVVEAMLREFFRQAQNVWPVKPLEGKSLYEAVTLASIVEKETGVPEERARVAGVFLNRLAKNMLLQTDPTVIYGLGESFDGNLRRAHLDDPKNPYNTYQLPGLPPGPICSPGLGALLAVAAPEIHDYYYFVATGEGAHRFSKTLNDHINAVNRFQRKRTTSP